jgi:hypothetical protein
VICDLRRITRLLLPVALSCGAASVPAQPELTPEELQARIQKAGDEPLEWLALLPLVGEGKAKEIRPKIHQLMLARVKQLGPDDRLQFAKQIAKLLPSVLHSPTEVIEVLGKNKKVYRQLLYHHWLEQWQFDQPLPLIVTFDHPKGQSARLISIQAGKVSPP